MRTVRRDLAGERQHLAVGVVLVLNCLLTVAVPVEGRVPETVQLVVHVEFRGRADDRLPAELTVEFLEAATRMPLVSSIVGTGNGLTVDLHAAVPLPAVGSVWEVEARAEGWWGPSLMISADRREINLILVPGGTVGLEVEGADRGVAMLSEDDVGLVGRVSSGAGTVAPLLDPGDYRSSCEVERSSDKRWVGVRCPFARGLATDLEVLLGPFIPFRRSAVTVSDYTDLGVAEAVRGGVVAGRFQGESRESTRFVLRRIDANSEFARLVWADGSGSVRFEGLDPGEYELGRVGSPDTWNAVIGSLYDAVDLGDLYPSSTRLAVSVLTPFFVRGDDLNLKLQAVTRLEDGSVYRRGRVAEAPSRDSGSGEWIWRDLPAGSYEVQIGDRFGNRLGREPIEFFGNDRVVVDVDAIPLEGEIRQGSEPLKDAMVWFGGAWGTERTALRSREDGYFEGWLPRSGHWFVEVSPAPSHCDPCEGEWDTADWGGFRPHPLREAGVIEVEPDGDGVARVEIELPAGGIEGRVFHPSPTTGLSELVSGANVSVTLPADALEQRDALLPGHWQETSDADGFFSVVGVPEGEYEVRATGGTGTRELRSPWIAVRVSKSGEMTAVDLHMEEQERVTLAVFSSHGLPIDGAQVFARATGTYRAVSGGNTRADGTAELWLPPAARQVEVVVRKRGMGMVAWRFDLEGGPIEIMLPDLRGSLRAPVTSSGAIISPGGVRWDTAHLRAINGAWQVHVEGSEYVVGELAPGRWMYCLSRDDCEPVDIAPWSESRVSQ